MGAGWRRCHEKVMQRLQPNDQKFSATSNARNEEMLREAHKFASHLKKVDAHIRRLQKDVNTMISDTRNIMLCSLPRTYDFTPSGQAVPDDPDPKLIGQNAQLDRFAAADSVLKLRLDEEVLEPLQSWIADFNETQAQMKKLEQLRLELDSRRRTVDHLHALTEKQHGVSESSSPKARAKLENTVQLMHRKENKKNAILAAFQEHEAHTYRALCTLLRDTSCLKDYTALAYSILQEVFGTGYTAFENGQVPGIPSSVQPPATGHWHAMPHPLQVAHQKNLLTC